MEKKQNKTSIDYSKGWLAGFDARQIDIMLAIRETKTRKELIKELNRTYYK